MLTYRSQIEKDADKGRMLDLLEALDATPMALRLDECDAWTISGKRGEIRTYGPDEGSGYQIMIWRCSDRAIGAAEKRIGFCKPPSIGNGLLLQKLPTREQAKAIRKSVGIPQYRRYSEQAVAAALGRLQAAKQG
jgi:hypothetical protein